MSADWSNCSKRALDELIAEKDEMIYEIRYLDGLGEDYGIEIYEWVDASHMLSGFTQQGLTIDDNSIIIRRDYNNIMSDMATEICNLRGLDLTDDNIDKIMKEFKEEK